jgi:hypothetical protein
MEYLFLWGVFPCAAYSLADGKGYNKKTWFVVGLLTGPVALLILAFLPATPDAKGGYR